MVYATEFFAIVFVAVCFSALISISFDRSEVVECNTWARQAQEYSTQFYLLGWQKAQCDAHGLIINAPVK